MAKLRHEEHSSVRSTSKTRTFLLCNETHFHHLLFDKHGEDKDTVNIFEGDRQR